MDDISFVMAMKVADTVIDNAEKTLKELFGVSVKITMVFNDTSHKEYLFQTLRNSICEETNLSWPQITKKARDAERVLARQIFSYIAYNEIGGKSLKEIGEEFGQDHTSVMSAKLKLAYLLKNKDAAATTMYNAVKKRFNEHQIKADKQPV